MEEHREHSDEEPDEYEELSVKSDEKYENGGEAGVGLNLKILTSWTVFSSV